MYTCITSSPAGESSWNGTLTVRVSGVPPPPRHSDSIQLPGPPQKPLVTRVTERSVTLTWQPNPHEGGAAVTSYVIEAFSQSEGSMWQTVVDLVEQERHVVGGLNPNTIYLFVQSVFSYSMSISCFSQSEGSMWQTVADLVEQERHVVGGLNPNTVYLFIVRALNSYGLSDPSPISEPVRTHDGDPTEEDAGIRRLQTDLRDATVFLNAPTILSPTSIHISWTLEGYAEAVQGYRLLYRPRGSAWLVQDLGAGPEHTHTLSKLRRGTEYDIKLRPFFTHRQGADSQLVTVRTPEEVLSTPPQNVHVSVLANSSLVQVTWEPPATPHKGLIQHYQIWCVCNETQVQVNRSVSGSVHSVLLEGLLPHSLYLVQVAAVTSGGVGPRSPPVMLLYMPARSDDIISLSEQIRGVVRTPAFIAGLGGALWLTLMTGSALLYCRHRRRKQLGHYTTSFSYTPAVGYANSDGIISGRPDLLGSDLADYPWLANTHSWPHTHLTHTSQDSANYCAGKQDSTDRYYNTVGISKYLSHSERFSGSSTEGPIYSTINPQQEQQQEEEGEEEELPDYTSQYSQYSHHSQHSQYSQCCTPPALRSKADLCSLERELHSWSLQSGRSTAEYAKLHMGNAQLMESSYQSSGSLDWADMLELTSQPTTREHTLSGANRDQRLGSDDDDDDWAPPLPERKYLMDTLPHDTPTLLHDTPTLPHDTPTLLHDIPTLPLRGGSLGRPPSYCTSFSLQSNTTLPPSPHHDPPADRPRPLDLLMRSPGHGPGSPFHQPCATLLSNPELGDITLPRLSSYWRDIMQIEGPYPGDSGKGQISALTSDVIPQSPKPHGRKKHSRDGQTRRQHSNTTDLPPPPVPPPGSERLQLLEDMLVGSRGEGGSFGGGREHGGSLEGGRMRLEERTGTGGSTGTGQRRKERPAPWNPEDQGGGDDDDDDDDDVILYAASATYAASTLYRLVATETNTTTSKTTNKQRLSELHKEKFDCRDSRTICSETTPAPRSEADKYIRC
ncbi:hypothetical protein ACEWY4_018825 [Coilia grayii]|uniref:Fibronectin type-III domain-containing protein n=1 Tax=Coilia grayii TaxID=363190 RepID=A0ABD1JED2_9TELE